MGITAELRRVNVRGIAMEYYDIQGNGGTLLILHGWAHSKERWRHVVEGLKGGLRIVIPDLPGFGESDKPAVSYTLAFFVEMVREFCRLVGVELTKSFLMGHSLGGAAAVCLSRDSSPRKLVLVAPILLPVWPARIARFMGPFGPGIFGLGRRSKLIVRLAARLTVAKPAHVDTVVVTGAAKPTDWSMTDALRHLAKIDLRTEVLALRVPTLLIYGTLDRAVPPRQYDFLKDSAHPNITLCPFPDAGHTPFVEDPARFLVRLEDFLF